MKGQVFPSTFVIQTCPAAIQGMCLLDKTSTTIEYAWKHADDKPALLFITAYTPILR